MLRRCSGSPVERRLLLKVACRRVTRCRSTSFPHCPLSHRSLRGQPHEGSVEPFPLDISKRLFFLRPVLSLADRFGCRPCQGLLALLGWALMAHPIQVRSPRFPCFSIASRSMVSLGTIQSLLCHSGVPDSRCRAGCPTNSCMKKWCLRRISKRT